MYFSAGTIPSYILLNNLKMLNTPWALIIPNCISVFNVIIMRSFFYGVPESLREAAEIDGAGPIRTLVRVYLPLSLPVIATLALFYAVGRWNGFSDALMYLKKSSAEKYWPIQLLLYNVIKNSTQTSEQAAQEGFFSNGVSKTIQMATVMFATVPILIVYPWLQRYFVSGVTIGAVKG
jgi:putative aldouronate transport system permease protein